MCIVSCTPESGFIFHSHFRWIPWFGLGTSWIWTPVVLSTYSLQSSHLLGIFNFHVSPFNLVCDIKVANIQCTCLFFQSSSYCFLPLGCNSCYLGRSYFSPPCSPELPWTTVPTALMVGFDPLTLVLPSLSFRCLVFVLLMLLLRFLVPHQTA